MKRQKRRSPLLRAGGVAIAIMCPSAAAKAGDICRVIKGKLSAWNGTPSLRIAVGKHVYGVVASSAHTLPAAITQQA
jgi:hypothetical protein